MGYSTEFDGTFLLDMTLRDEQRDYLLQFSETRRMKRDVAVLEGKKERAESKYPATIQKVDNFNDPIREAVNLPLGIDGAYFVGGRGNVGEIHDQSIIDFSCPPEDQPSLWCGWTPTKDAKGIEWNGVEKFLHYIEWLEYIIEHFLKPWGYVLNGEVDWQGDDSEDLGTIVVVDNKITY
jgi:hypothetical protein